MVLLKAFCWLQASPQTSKEKYLTQRYDWIRRAYEDSVSGKLNVTL